MTDIKIEESLLGTAQDQGGIRSQEPDSIMKTFLREKTNKKERCKNEIL